MLRNTHCNISLQIYYYTPIIDCFCFSLIIHVEFVKGTMICNDQLVAVYVSQPTHTHTHTILAVNERLHSIPLDSHSNRIFRIKIRKEKIVILCFAQFWGARHSGYHNCDATIPGRSWEMIIFFTMKITHWFNLKSHINNGFVCRDY